MAAETQWSYHYTLFRLVSEIVKAEQTQLSNMSRDDIIRLVTDVNKALGGSGGSQTLDTGGSSSKEGRSRLGLP